MPEFLSNEEIVIAARKNLQQGAWDYLVGGSESETTLRRNRLAFDRVAFRPRVLRDVSKIDTSTTFLGHKLRIPVMLAPIGSLQAFTPTGGGARRRRPRRSSASSTSSARRRSRRWRRSAAASDAPKIFQLYVHGDDDWVEDIVTRAAKAGYSGLGAHGRPAVDSRRERPDAHPLDAPAAAAWLRQDLPGGADLGEAGLDPRPDAGACRFMLKGVQSAEDAELAVEHGVDVIWVSNHGGRQLDTALGSLDVLPEVMHVVARQGRGHRRRRRPARHRHPQGGRAGRQTPSRSAGCRRWGLAAAGKDGVVRVLEILENEMITAMGLLGVTSIDQLGPEYLTKAERVTPPHEMSAWVNMPGYRLL